MSVDKHKKAYTYTLMIRAHCAALLPPLVNDIPEYREYIEFISRVVLMLCHIVPRPQTYMMKQLVYLTAESTNWRVNNVMDCWSINEGNFPNIAKMALKYLAVPASSACHLLNVFFSQLKLILDRKRWRTDADRLERILFLRCNKNFSA